MTLCNKIKEEIVKSHIGSLIKAVKEAIKDDSEMFEIAKVDGKIVVSDGEIESGEEDITIEELSPIKSFSEFVMEVGSNEDIHGIGKVEIEKVIKGLKNLKIDRKADVPAIKAGSSEFEDAGTVESEFEITLQDYKYDPKKDILNIKRFK